MRRPNLKRCLGGLTVGTALALALGCGDNPGTGADAKKPGMSRDMVEHPLDVVGGEKKPQKPLTPKEQAALNKAKQADPRGR
jgi:hypothetical protein